MPPRTRRSRAAGGVPPGVGLRRALEWNHRAIKCVAFDPGLQKLAGGGLDGTITLWDTVEGTLLRTFERRRSQFEWQRSEIASVAFDPAGRDGAIPRLFERHRSPVSSVGFEPTGRMLAIGSLDNTVKLWDVPNSKLRRVLEGHRGSVVALSFHQSKPLFATMGWDDTIRIWSSETWDVLAVIQRHAHYRFRGLSFHPSLPRLAAAGARLSLYELDLDVLLGERPTAPATRTVHYVNAKVVLVGDTGVGKTGLSLVLSGRPFQATDSTAGRQVWPLGTSEDEMAGERRRTRETLLWDLAGQPGYRVIHQLHLSEVAVALVVFDARSETDPLAGVVHWDRALRAGHQRQGSEAVPLTKFLVSARADRGGVPVSKERLEALLR